MDSISYSQGHIKNGTSSGAAVWGLAAPCSLEPALLPRLLLQLQESSCFSFKVLGLQVGTLCPKVPGLESKYSIHSHHVDHFCLFVCLFVCFTGSRNALEFGVVVHNHLSVNTPPIP